MIKNFTKSIAVLALALGCGISANAQGRIQGYFRVSNAETGKYVEVTGPFSADPTQSKSDAQYKAGTIIYVEAEQPANENAYKVTSLRSQGIEVVGNYLDDYYEKLIDVVFTESGFNSNEEALWNVVKGGFQYGYTSIGRAAIQTMICIVAERLDQEGDVMTGEELETLEAFAKRFNTEVAQYIDLGIRLEPVDGVENGFRLYYETPDLQVVSDWYQKPENKETFEKGFEAMRHYLTAKMGQTGEGLDPSEIEEMKGWGYNPLDKYSEYLNSDGVIVLSYEKIFADPDLLFNWLKLNVIKFTDPERCPDIDLRGLHLPDFAVEMQKHRITKQIIDYFPRLQTNQRIYLCDGKGGVTEHFDFTSAEGAESLGAYAQWVMHKVDNADEQLLVKDMKETDGQYYTAVYYDFPVAAADENTSVNQLTAEADNMLGYKYVKLVPAAQIPLQTALVVVTDKEETQLLVGDGNPTITPLEEVRPGFVVSDKPAAKQYTRRRIDEETLTASEDHFTGVLLSTTLTKKDLWNYRDIDMDMTPVYIFRGSGTVEGINNPLFGNGTEAQTLGPNQALYTPFELNAKDDIVLIGNLMINVEVGETNTGEEETDSKDESEHIRIAQAFNGNDANVFENLVTFPVELTYNEDFTVTVSIPEAVDDAKWETPEDPSDLFASYQQAFGSESWIFEQYQAIFGNTEVGDMSEDVVDGFYLASHLDHDRTAVLEEPTVADGENTGYEYNLSFDAPCSGIYEITIAPTENSQVDFTTTISKVKIYPNLYAKFGPNEEPGFNIDGCKFEEEDGKYYITLPKFDEYNSPYDLSHCTGFIPGTYFASSLVADAGGKAVRTNIRRNANVEPDGKYAVLLPNLEDIVNQDTPLTMTVTKNGVTASYDFYIKQDISTTVDGVLVEDNASCVYYNLQGVKIMNPEKGGVYLKVVDGKASKVIF